jgi:hypothetical protein
MFVRFLVVTAASMNVAVFWDIAPYSPVDTDQRFRDVYHGHHQGDKEKMLGAVRTSETSVNF